MDSVVFPDALHKVYLTASAEERGKRRYNQLIRKGISANLTDVIHDIEQRDERDKNRTASPLVVPKDAPKANECFRKAAEMGDARGCYLTYLDSNDLKYLYKAVR